MSASTEFLQTLQRNPDCIRNVCVIAHVDHGKTTLSDCLIASNGIISSRLAGEIRYMDSLPEEQQRQITMKSSSISLLFNHMTRKSQHLINLVDSPGHVDFLGEVSTALRVLDGAIVVVDVVEGVCVQTETVIRHAWEAGVTMCLVLNKVDKLLLELKLSPSEATQRISEVLASVNAVVGDLRSAAEIIERETGRRKGEDDVAAVVVKEVLSASA